jgi:hypothetical protein
MHISIKSNVPEIERRLDDLVTKQAPFALSLALNKAIKSSRDIDLRMEYGKFFEVRNKAFFKQVHQIRNSTARHIRRTGMALASIQRSDLPSPPGARPETRGRKAQTRFMEKHVTGGIKTPRLKRNLAIPIEANVSRKRSGARAGAVNKSFEPRNIMQSGKGFILQKGSKSFIAKRTGKKKIKILHSLAKSATIRGGYNPERAVKRGMNKYFKIMYKQAWIQALRTAKLR